VCFRAKAWVFDAAAIANEALLWCSSGSHAEFVAAGCRVDLSILLAVEEPKVCWACRAIGSVLLLGVKGI
jgi:hypothetical protein